MLTALLLSATARADLAPEPMVGEQELLIGASGTACCCGVAVMVLLVVVVVMRSRGS